MALDWKGFLQRAAPAAHGVQLYREPSELAKSVGAYLAAGLDAGEPALVIATPEHWEAFARSLDLCGWDVVDVARSELVQVFDAEDVLASFLVGEQPSGPLFRETMDSVLDSIEARWPGRHVRAFGEMVDVLWSRGNAAGTATLERLWHELLHERPRFSLLCGYRLDPFDLEAQVAVLPAVCGTHSHVLPAEDTERFQHSVDAALHEFLGANAATVYGVVAGSRRDLQVPSAQLALMWISANMPAHAERILASARRNYELAELAAA